MRDIHKLRDKHVLRLDGGQLTTFFFVLLASLAGAFYAGMTFERMQPWGSFAVYDGPFVDGGTIPAPLVEAREPSEATTPETVDAVLPAEKPRRATPTAAQTAEVPARKTKGRVDPSEMGPRPLSVATYADEPDVDHPAPAADRATEGESSGNLNMPEFLLDIDPADTDTGSYTLQVKAFREEPEATSFLEELKDGGYEAFLVHSDIPGKGRWYRVRVGQFGSLTEATSFQQAFEQKEGYSTFVSPL